MSEYKRMIVILQKEYIQLKSMQYVKQSETQMMGELTQFNQEQPQIKDPHEKLQFYVETLDAMTDLKERIRDERSLGGHAQTPSQCSSL